MTRVQLRIGKMVVVVVAGRVCGVWITKSRVRGNSTGDGGLHGHGLEIPPITFVTQYIYWSYEWIGKCKMSRERRLDEHALDCK